MKRLTKSIMLGLLLIPFAALINSSESAYAGEATVGMVAGSSVPGCEADDSCWDPTILTVPVGTTVTWVNDDSTAHSVTGASDPTDPNTWGDITVGGELFDSGFPFVKPGETYSFTFTEAGEYPYFCQLHATWMIGKVIVEEAAGGMDGKPSGGMAMTGTSLDLNIDPALPFDRTANDMVTLSFTAKAKELEGASATPGKIDHLDYRVIITKDGSEVWRSGQFHDHDGNLELQITPSSGSVTVTGGDEDSRKSMTGPYMVSGPIFTENGNYGITGQIVGIEFQDLPTPMQDDFSIEVVPEFPITAILPMVLGLAAVMAVMRLRPNRSVI